MTLYVGIRQGKLSVAETLGFMGWWPVDVMAVGRSMLLLGCLFAGPLFEAGFVEGGWKDWVKGRHLTETLASSVGWRNYVAVCFLLTHRYPYVYYI